MRLWQLSRAVITALAFLSVSAALAAVPGRGLEFWHLYFSPVMIAALSFGVSGALVGAFATVVAIVSLYLRFDQTVIGAGTGLLSLVFGTGSATVDLQHAVTNAPSSIWVRLGNSVVGLRSAEDMLIQAVIGVVLIAGVGTLVGWLVDENRRREALYQYEARTDELTGVGNYRSLMDSLNEEIARAARFHRKIAFFMIDVDSLKPYNDTYGHQLGDRVLHEIGQTLRSQVREVDVVCRYGGDEFAIILLEPTREGALMAADRLRQAIAARVVSVHGVEARVTVSIGGALYPDDARTPVELVAAADSALYEAKLGGKNMVRMVTEEQAHPATDVPTAG